MAQDRTAEIVAFDFDGTLTIEDSFTAFLKWRAGPWRYGLGCVRLIPAGVAYLFHRDRGRIKAAGVAVFLKGATRRDLEVEAQRFADLAWDRFMRPDALAAWARWRRDGARLVIVTASPDLTVGPFARRLGADDLLGTQLAFDGEDRVTGAFAGPNCRGPEKVVRLTQAFGPALKLRAAYGDTSGDTEMLALAEEPGYRVFSGRP